MLWNRPGALFVETSAEEHPKSMSSLPWAAGELSWDGKIPPESKLCMKTWGGISPFLLAGCSRGDAKRGDVIPALSVAERALGGVQLGLKQMPEPG